MVLRSNKDCVKGILLMYNEDSIVYISNYHPYDFSLAKEYGKLVPVTKGSVNIFKLEDLQKDVENALNKFDNKKDYLLLVGNLVVNILCVTYILSKFPFVRCLIYGAKKHDYTCVTIKRDFNEQADLA